MQQVQYNKILVLCHSLWTFTTFHCINVLYHYNIPIIVQVFFYVSIILYIYISFLFFSWMTHSVDTCSQSRDVHCLDECSQFYIIVRHIKEMDSSVPAALRGPPTWQRVTPGQHLFIKAVSVSQGFGWMLRNIRRNHFLGPISLNQSDVLKDNAAILVLSI